MSERTRFVGLDAHAATIAVAVADQDGSVSEHGIIVNDPHAVRTLITRLSAAEVRLQLAYEAGPTGYALHRQLTSLGVACMVVAPSLIPRRPGDRVKTDSRDAVTLARLLRSGDLTPVWVPNATHEALRNLVRARADAKVDELRARHRLSKFLLRQGMRPPAGMRAWSRKHDSWLHQLSFAESADQVVVDDYRATVTTATERVRRLETALLQQATTSPQVRVIAALQAFHGIGFLSAVTITAEVGDLRRFATAPQLMAYAGLVPSEHSSGAARRRGHITKTGNGHLRHVLGEAAHHARHAPSSRTWARQRRDGMPAPIVALAQRSHERLHLRYRHLAGRIGRPKALTAVSRELAGFIWALGQLLEETTVLETVSV
jgi:transposase